MPWLNRRWISFFAVSAAVIIIGISIVGWRNYEAGVNTRSTANAYGVDLTSTDEANLATNWTSDSLVLGSVINIDSFDPGKSSSALGFRIDFYPLNQLVSDNVTEVSPKVPVRLVLMSKTVSFVANSVMPFHTVSQILEGSINSFPFDSYTVDYTISAYTSPTKKSYGTRMPNTVYVQGAIQGFLVDSSFQGLSDDGSQVKVTLTVRRSATSKAFAVIIFLVMWALSLSIFTAAMSVWFREKTAELGVIAISTGLLFALPNVRNSQPGIPPIAGTTSDMIGFFWNIMLVAISAISLLMNWIIKTGRKRPKPAPTAVDPSRQNAEQIPLLTMR